MKIIIIGGGIIGVTSAYYLAQQGAEVTVLERRADVAQETSAGNAGVIAPGYVTPWAAPGMPQKIMKSLFATHSPVIFRPQFSFAQWAWLKAWLGECKLERYRYNKSRMRSLAQFSRTQLHIVREKLGINYAAHTGYLQLMRSPADMALAQPALNLLRESATEFELCSPQRCFEIEPSLQDSNSALHAGIYLPNDESGDCAAFARALRPHCEALGVEFKFNTTVCNFAQTGDVISHVQCLKNGKPLDYAADKVVLSAGVESTHLARKLGIQLPLYPIKGYSMTVPIDENCDAIQGSVMDENFKVALTRMGNSLRVAGTAELGDWQVRPRPAAVHTLLRVLRDWQPNLNPSDESVKQAWCGLRPMTPFGAPIISASAVPNLFLNLGQGSTGWAMSCGSAALLTDLILQRTAKINLDHYAL